MFTSAKGITPKQESKKVNIMKTRFDKENTSFDTSLAKVTAPMTGVHNIYDTRMFSTTNHPPHVGLVVEELEPQNGEFARDRIHGVIDRDIVDTHGRVRMADNKVLYKAGKYDLIVVQKKAEDWSGWFND